MRCKQKCTQLLGSIVFSFLLGGMWLLWLEPSSHLGPWGYVSTTTLRTLTVSWKDPGSWQFCGATILVLGCLSSRFILHKKRHTFLSPLSQCNFLLLFWHLVKLDPNGYRLVHFYHLPNVGVVDSPVGNQEKVVSLWRREPESSWSWFHVYSCLFLPCPMDPTVSTALKSWVLLCVFGWVGLGVEP